MVDFREGTADSMSILAILLSIAFFGVIFIFLTDPINGIIDSVNGAVTTGQLSEDTVRFFNKCIDLWKATPFFMVLGLILYVLERSKGSDIPIQTYFSYLFGMVLGIIVSAVFVYCFGYLIDTVHNTLATALIMDVPASWDQSGTINFVIKILYYVCLIPGYIGSILYMFHPVIKQTANVFDDGSYEAEESLDDFNMNQF